MDGFGRTPGAVLLEHWPRVHFPDLDVVSYIENLPHRDCPNHNNRILLPEIINALDTVSPYEPEEEQIHCNKQLEHREMEIFRSKVMLWRVRSAECLNYLIQYGLDVNGVADRRRASTLLHIAARYDLTDVIVMLIKSGSENCMGSRISRIDNGPENLSNAKANEELQKSERYSSTAVKHGVRLKFFRKQTVPTFGEAKSKAVSRGTLGNCIEDCGGAAAADDTKATFRDVVRRWTSRILQRSQKSSDAEKNQCRLKRTLTYSERKHIYIPRNVKRSAKRRKSSERGARTSENRQGQVCFPF